jgi:MinD superfamily P-loop ATPase
MNKKAGIILNKSDVGDKKQIIELSDRYGSEIVFEIPYSKDIVAAYSEGRPIVIKDIVSSILDEKK